MTTRKICVIVASRANYGRVKSVMQAIQQHPRLELQLIVGASALLSRFGRSLKVIETDGFRPERTLSYIVEGETLLTQAKSTGLGIIELSTAFSDLKPDMVVTVADRFETMATAIASSYMNISLVHIQGGELSGNIDERVRHAVTKLSDFHFVATEAARKRVLAMGEEPHRVFNFGCPAIDLLAEADLSISDGKMQRYGGVGASMDWSKPYILMVQHPVTTSCEEGQRQVTETLHALRRFGDLQKVVLWPNADAGSELVAKGIRMFREQHMSENFHYYKNLSPEDYASLMNNAVCVVGNSSSFIRECAYLGVPAVIVGERQENREHGRNVEFCDYDREEIAARLGIQAARTRFELDPMFGEGDAGEKIAAELAKLDLEPIKRNTV